MKNIFRIMAFPVLAVVIMLLTQIIVSFMVVMGSIVASGEIITTGTDNIPMVSGEVLSLALLLSSIVTIVIIMLIRQFGLQKAFSRLGCSVPNAVLAFIGIFLGTFASNILVELCHLPNSMEEEFLGMSQGVLGILAIGFIGPVCEELVFRGAVMRPMLSQGVNPWVVVFTSAAVFGIIHWNPIQIPFAMMIGFMYGIVYLRTGSLVITTICHIINNTTSVVMMNRMGKESLEATFVGEFGMTTTIIALIASLVLCIVCLKLFWERSQPQSYAPGTTSAY